ncbi:hypothetical protein WJX81_008508 [Elliptochloris bilobata]|uniref:HhH-GPD domain-containing protein n=1 Tax=Elliptochloris bilobata TaxID=381761 RepID=A0AAW1S5P1_9CHLO
MKLIFSLLLALKERTEGRGEGRKEGQSFRWRREEASAEPAYQGVIGQRAVCLAQGASGVQYRVLARGASAEPDDDAKALAEYFFLSRRLAPLTAEWAERDERFRSIAACFPGVRVLRQDPVECLFSFICSSNNHISRITGMAPQFHAFPTLDQLAQATEEDLRAAGFGYRAKYVVNAAAELKKKPGGGASWLRGLREVPYGEAAEALCTLPGIGPKVAACICLFSLDKAAAIPVDTHVWQLAARYYLPNLRGKKPSKAHNATILWQLTTLGTLGSNYQAESSIDPTFTTGVLALPQATLQNNGTVFITADTSPAGRRHLLSLPFYRVRVLGATPSVLSVPPAILELPGTYSGAGNINVVYNSRPITVQGIGGAAVTLFDTQGTSSAFRFVGTETSTSILKGVTVWNSLLMSLGPAAAYSGNGGGLFITSSPDIQDCVFKLLAVTGNGGGVAVIGVPGTGWPASFYYPCNAQGACEWFIPTAVHPAGYAPFVAWTSANAHPTFERCTFANNYAAMGAGIYAFEASITMSDCLIDSNTGEGQGGGVYSRFASWHFDRLNVTNNVAKGAGAALMGEYTIAPHIDSLIITGNNADTFGGALNANFAFMLFTNTFVDNNYAGLFCGGLFAIFSEVFVFTSVVSNNRALIGGGGLKNLQSIMVMDGTTVKSNQAQYGSGIDISNAGNTGMACPTLVLAQNSVFTLNSATEKGAGFSIFNIYLGSFTNVTFHDNFAPNGGAVVIAGDGLTAPPGDPFPWRNQVTMTNCTFTSNKAAYGGAIFVDQQARASIVGGLFDSNTARAAGGAIVTSSSVVFTMTGITFTNNGNLKCYEPPLSGGAINIGFDIFSSASSCATNPNPPAASMVTMDTCTLSGNLASNYGGGISVQDGVFVLQNSNITGNQVGSTGTLLGWGGGVYVADHCTNGVCGHTAATLTNNQIGSNYAHEAGGGVFFDSAAGHSSMSVINSMISNNFVDYSLVGNSHDGLGGGIFLNHYNFVLSNLSVSGNAAYFGAGLYVSTDVTNNATLSSLAFNSNVGKLGTSIYWLHRKSASTPVVCTSCTTAPASLGATATEAITLQFLVSPPTSVQSNQAGTPFQAGVMDYYGNVVTSENLGSCAVTYSGIELDLPDSGRLTSLVGGVGNFSQFTVVGGIGHNFTLNVSCQLTTIDQNALIPPLLPIAPLSFPLRIELCPEGTQQKGPLCAPCDQNTFNFDGIKCQSCPTGASCPGGTFGMQTPLLSLQNYWRSSNTSSSLYHCPFLNACHGYPTYSGVDAGDAACKMGYYGPLCQICMNGWICLGSGPVTMGVAVAIFGVFLIMIFIFDIGGEDEDGPGMNSKIKIIQTHFQIMSLLQTYDVKWPNSTKQVLTWSKIVNVGVGITAPDCVDYNWNFLLQYIVTMVSPICLVILCIIIWGFAGLQRFMRLRQLDQPQASLEHEEKLNYSVAKAEALQNRCYKNAFWIVSLLYPNIAQTALQLFSVQKLDIGTYLRTDYQILTHDVDGTISPTYRTYVPPGILVLIIFAIGLPIMFFYVLWRVRDRLEDVTIKAQFGYLYSGYRLPFWEITEMARKLVMAAVPVFIPVQTVGSLQAVVGEILLVAFMVLTIYLHPYESKHDNWMQVGSIIVLFLLLISGEALKWAEITTGQLNGIGVLQLILTGCVGFSVAIWMIMNPRKVYKSITNKVDSAKKMYESASNVALRASNAAVRASAAAGRLSSRVSARTSSAVGRLSRTASGRARALSVRVSTAMRRTSSVRRVAADDGGGTPPVDSMMVMPGADEIVMAPTNHTGGDAGGDDVFTARLKAKVVGAATHQDSVKLLLGEDSTAGEIGADYHASGHDGHTNFGGNGSAPEMDSLRTFHNAWGAGEHQGEHHEDSGGHHASTSRPGGGADQY